MAKAELNAKLKETEKVRAERLSVLNERKKENTKLQNEKNKQNKLIFLFMKNLLIFCNMPIILFIGILGVRKRLRRQNKKINLFF